MFLSATASSSVVMLVARRAQRASSRPMPKLFVESCPLPENHFYLVERKTNLQHVASRIVEILAECHEPEPKAVCYFVGRQVAGQFRGLLESLGIRSNIFVGAESQEQKTENCKVLSDFKGPKVQVLCANSALGRGVDDLPKNIRFCFHVQMPESLGKFSFTLICAERFGNHSLSRRGIPSADWKGWPGWCFDVLLHVLPCGRLHHGKAD